MALKVKTRGNAQPNGKPRVYISDHGQADSRWRDLLIADLLELCDCAVFYHEETASEPEEAELPLEQMQLLVIPVTRALLTTENKTLQQDLPYALAHKMGILPIMLEGDLLAEYGRAFGKLQFLDRTAQDATARSYKEKLASFLSAVLIKEEQAQKIREAFDSYIFLSYRKKDRKHANDLMRLIHGVDNFAEVAIWYDEYLTPGEDFNDTIEQALKKAPVFVLTVTPNLLAPGNYVLDYEYPAAVKHQKPVLPVEMEKTNFAQLQSAFRGIDQCKDPEDKAALKAALDRCFQGVPLGSKRSDPEHMYLMGLAYLNGIDVEVDRYRAADYISRAALASYPDAVEKMAEMYTYGIGVERDWLKAQVWRFTLHQILRKKGYTKDHQSMQAYLENLQIVLEKAPYAERNARLTQWALDALNDFVRYNQEPSDPKCRELVAEAMILAYEKGRVDEDTLIAYIQKLLKNESSEERKRLLIRVYLAKKDSWELSNKAHREIQKAKKLCRQLLKKERDPEVMLYLAKAIYYGNSETWGDSVLSFLSKLCDNGLLWDIHYALDQKIKERENKYYMEAVELCRALLENDQNIPAARLLAEICDRHYYALAKGERDTLVRQAYERLKRIYAHTADKDDLQLLRWLGGKIAGSPTEKQLQKKQFECLREHETEERHKKTMLQYALQLNKVARAQKLDPNGAWDGYLVALDACFSFKEYDIVEEGAFLRCARRNGQGASIASRAKAAWENRADLLAAGVYRDILMGRQRNEANSDEDRFADGVEAMCVYSQMIGLDWRLRVWQKEETPRYQPLIKARPITEQLEKQLREKPALERTAAMMRSVVADGYLLAMDALEQGDELGALNHSFRVEKLLPCAGPAAQLCELIAYLLREAPVEVQEEWLQKANACHEQQKCAHAKIAMAMNNSQLAEFALQRGDAERARQLLEQIIFAKIPYVKRSAPILDRIQEQYQNVLQGVAPKEAQRSKNYYISDLENYLSKEKDPQKLARYVELLPEDAVPAEELLPDIIEYAFWSLAAEVRPKVSQALYNWLRKCKDWDIFNKEALLRYQKECLTLADSLENRRYFALGAVKIGMSPAEARLEATAAGTVWLGRLEKAKRLLLEVKDRWTEEDRWIYSELELCLAEARPEESAPEEKEKLQQQSREYQPEEVFLKAAEEETMRVYRYHAEKSRWGEKEDPLDEILQRIEAGLDKNYSIACYVDTYYVVQRIQGYLKKKNLRAQPEQLQKKLVQKLYELLRTMPEQERKWALRASAAILRKEGLMEAALPWVDALFEKETKNADPRDLALYLKEYGDFYLSLGAFEKAEQLYLQYVDRTEGRTQEELRNALFDAVYGFARQECWKTATLFVKKFLERISLDPKETVFNIWDLYSLVSHVSGLLYNENYSDREIERNYGEMLDAIEQFLKEDFGPLKKEAFEIVYGYSCMRRAVLKRGIALAKELNFDKYTIDKLKKQYRWLRKRSR